MNIKIEKLNKTYKKQFKYIEVLKNINLEIYSGQKIALIGPSGSGKSTLIHILGFMDKPSSGKIYIDNVDYVTEKNKYLCDFRKKNIGFIFQEHYLMYDFTVIENIIIPVWDKRESKILKAEYILKKIGLLNKKNNFPFELSGGEKQKVALARALINEPKIMFADEPTGNLDKKSCDEVENLLFESVSEISSILFFVTHNEKFASKANRIIEIVNGRLK
jgi:ABC-type lipoprotein export system ATPase subunit